MIETDPHNETLEVWNDFAESLATIAVFGGLTILIGMPIPHSVDNILA